MGKFASHMETKAQAFEAAAKAWADNPPADNQLGACRQPSEHFIHHQWMASWPIIRVQSKNLVQNIKNDAEVVKAAQGKLTQYAKGESLKSQKLLLLLWMQGGSYRFRSSKTITNQAGAPTPPTNTTSAPTASEESQDEFDELLGDMGRAARSKPWYTAWGIRSSCNVFQGAPDANADISSMSDEDLRWELRRLDGKVLMA